VGASARVGNHGLVLGAGVAGLLAARVLSEVFERVTVVERDVLPNRPERRRGVPQDRHPHLLQAGGAQAIEALLPGFLDELEAAGSVVVTEDYSRFHFEIGEHLVATTGPPKDPLTFHLQTRPFLEACIRRRVLALPNVRLRDGHVVTELAASPSGEVGGAKVKAPGGEEALVAADLVVDAMGRGGRTPAFLADHGFGRPPEQRVVARVTYSAQLLRWPIDTLPAVVVSVDATPQHPVGMLLIPQEDATAMFWLGGMVGHEPPARFEDMIVCAEGFCPPDVVAAVRAAPPIGTASQHRIPAAVWRRYDRMRAFPRGLLPIGDAISVFNPTYGQGMSVAAMQASTLRRCLAEGPTDLTRRFFRATRKDVAAAWSLAAAADLAYPDAVGDRTLQVRLSHRLEQPFLTASEVDVEVYSQLLKVGAFVAPPSSLFSPRFLLRVLRGARRARKQRAGASPRHATDRVRVDQGAAGQPSGGGPADAR
jgi:2-polyprenyl-6-methoxyphenol hydroxylase-like FAD-dependent oxidoreductase